MKDVHRMISLVDHMFDEHGTIASSCTKITLKEVKESLTKLLQQLQTPTRLPSMEDDAPSQESSDNFSTHETISKHHFLPPAGTTSIDDVAAPSVMDLWKAIDDVDQADGMLGGPSEFTWDCPDSLTDRSTPQSLTAKRKISTSEAPNRRARDNTMFETVASNAFPRGTGVPSSTSGPSRRDTFRQRKPNTSRPPSMHVDDYVARERNVDGLSISANIGSSQRGGSTSGRPPSIHVDEFMARQRERQSPMAGIAEVSQTKNPTLETDSCLPDKSDTAQLIKTDLEDDHEIDIVFDEESESEDRLPFPQPDDNIQPATVLAGESSPGSIVEENEGDINGDSQSEFLSRPSISRPEVQLGEENIPSDKSRHRANARRSFSIEQYDDSKYNTTVSKRPDDFDSRSSYGFPRNKYSISAPTRDVRPSSSRFYLQGSPQKPQNIISTANSQGYYEQKVPMNQPTLPPTPPPSVSSVPSVTVEHVQHPQSTYFQHNRDMQPPLPSGFPVQVYDSSASSKLAGPHKSEGSGYMDAKHSWAAGSPRNRLHEAYTTSTSARPMPPLPPTPPPFPTSSISHSLTNAGPHSTFPSSQYPLSSPLNDPRLSLFSNAGGSPSFAVSQITSQVLLARPVSIPSAPSASCQPPALNTSHIPPVIPSSLSPVQNVHANSLPPPPPPQLPRPLHLSQPLRQPLQVSQTQQEQMLSLQQNCVHIQPLQLPQPVQIPQLHLYYQAQQESLQQAPPPLTEKTQTMNQHGPSESVSEPDSGATLQQYFSSPEAIQSLLSDRDKLCQLLEQHPKLMQMLQERLGQI